MKPDTEKLMQAYLEIYNDFEALYNVHIFMQEGRDLGVGTELQKVKLFEIAMNDSLLGEVLKEEILQKYKEILEAEQAKQEAEEEAEAGEAMMI